ncbi:MAG TPA: TlpA disulfide reductase family protein [Nitrospira sp.]|nr:TlpA disulfide reductase family protein [Nitrospira sp.]
MLRNRRPIPYAVILAGIAGMVAAGSLQAAKSEPADAFSAVGIARTTATAKAAVFNLNALDGAPISSHDLMGKVVVLNFWATWCGPCKEEMPSLARLQSHFDPEQVRVVTVTTDRYPQGIKQFLDHLGIKLPVLFDDDEEVSRRFMVRGLPTTLLIGQDGQALGRAVGPRTWDSRESIALVREILDRRP